MTVQRIWPATDGPNTSGSDGQAINVGTEFFVSTPAWVIALRWYRGTTSVNADNLRLYQVTSSSTGTQLAEVLTPATAGVGWQESSITPVLLTAGVRYKTVAHMPDHYTATGGYWTGGGPGSAGITNGFLTAPNTGNADGGGQGTFKYGVAAFPDGSFNGGNYWVDVVVTDVDPSGAVDVGQSLELDSGQAVASVHVVDVGQALELDSAGVVLAGSAPETSLRVRVSGTEPTRFARGTEPSRQVSGREAGTP